MNSTVPLPNSTPYRIIAVILASGKGSRFGQPKSEASVDGMRFSEHIMHTLNAAGIEDIILARDYHTASMLGTLRKAVAERKADYYMIFPVDHPFVQADSVRVLLAALLPDTILKPVFDGHSGHPIIIPATLDLNRDDSGEGLKGIIRGSGMPCKYIAVDDPGILRNINRPEDLWVSEE